tara:strand:+ start:1050 stop:1340 length:291 start_codon:yes stop_codon:yes gene_type:complete
MPTCTELVRADGSGSAKFHGWSWWHLTNMHNAMIKENGGVEEGVEVFPYGYVFKDKHVFQDLETRIWNRGGDEGVTHVMEIFPGDTYNCWRESSSR